MCVIRIVPVLVLLLPACLRNLTGHCRNASLEYGLLFLLFPVTILGFMLFKLAGFALYNVLLFVSGLSSRI